jgi:glycosyltransferase involved in cell wall biosynthesis
LYRIDKIIQAFATLIKNNLIDTEYRLVIAGSGEESANLEQLAQDLSVSARINFVGMLNYSELVELYRHAQLFISVPESDGTSSSLLEALAYGCIPVLSNLPANLEWVLDQVNGFIAPEVGQLQQQILAAIQLSQNIVEYQKLGNFNHHMILEKASFSHNIRRFIELY